MAENSIDDKYKIPDEIILEARLYDNFSWIRSGVPLIKSPYDITFYEEFGDYVYSQELYNIVDEGLVIQFILPDLPNNLENTFYGGTGYYYIELLGSNSFKTYDYDGNEMIHLYNAGDLFSLEFEGTTIDYKLNGTTIVTYNIDPEQLFDRIWIGYNSSILNSTNNINISGINCFSSCVNGINGNNGVSILSDIVNPSDEIGISGDFSYNLSANTFFGRKQGACGSLFFNGVVGNNTKLSIPNDIDFRMRTNIFTIEWFQYITDVTLGRIFSINTNEFSVSIEGTITSQTISLWINGIGVPLYSGNVLKKWTHVAIVRNNSYSIALYINGVVSNSVFNDSDLNNTTDSLLIGNELAEPDYGAYKGYITNFRWVNGSALYTSNFNVPVSPLISVPNTKLLLTSLTKSGAFVDTSGCFKSIYNTNVFWDVFTPIKSTGSWNVGTVSPLILNDTSQIVSVSQNVNTVIWDFTVNGFTSIIILISFARSGIAQPVSFIQIAVNNGINGPQINVLGQLPTNITVNGYFNGGLSYVYLTSTSSLVTYNNTSVRVIPII